MLTPDERKKILAAIKDQPFRDFVFAMQETGCRPGEVARLPRRTSNLELGHLGSAQAQDGEEDRQAPHRLPHPGHGRADHEARRRSTPRGRSSAARGAEQPFTRNSIRCRFRRLREKLPHLAGVVAYSYRHTFCTDALVNGVGVAQVAELMGHTATDMVTAVYSKLAGQVDHLRAAAKKASGS